MRTPRPIHGLPALAFLAAILLPSPADALRKTLKRMPTQDRAEEWHVGGTCSVAYYNNCTAWVWVWDNFGDGDLFGTVFDACCGSGGVLVGSFQYFLTGSGACYGITSYVSVHAVDENDCPVQPPLAETVYIPTGSGWEYVAWGVPVPERFAVVFETQYHWLHFDRLLVFSDGPGGCGNCFPTTRPTNSYLFGNVDAPLCPPSPLHDGECYVEWLAIASMSCPISVEDNSWGDLKALYR